MKKIQYKCVECGRKIKVGEHRCLKHDLEYCKQAYTDKAYKVLGLESENKTLAQEISNLKWSLETCQRELAYANGKNDGLKLSFNLKEDKSFTSATESIMGMR